MSRRPELDGCRQGKTAPPEALAKRLAARESARAELQTRMDERLRRRHTDR